MNSKFHKTIEEYKNKIRYFNYSKRTEQIYIHYFEKFLEYIDKYPQHLTFSAGELLSLYFYGINIQVRDGSEFDKTVVEFYIKQAQKLFEDYLQIKLFPCLISEKIGYYRDDYYGKYPIFQTKYPVLDY